jgi:hypothetical protein
MNTNQTENLALAIFSTIMGAMGATLLSIVPILILLPKEESWGSGLIGGAVSVIIISLITMFYEIEKSPFDSMNLVIENNFCILGALIVILVNINNF